MCLTAREFISYRNRAKRDYIARQYIAFCETKYIAIRRKTMQVKFYDNIEDEKLLFAVILTKHNNKWVFCKHKSRNTYEIPGGHREQGETILETAKRELYEETGAIKYEIKPVTVYSVIDGDTETFGKLYFAEVQEFEKELHSEIELIKLFDDMPENLTYPLIQPKLMEAYKQLSLPNGK